MYIVRQDQLKSYLLRKVKLDLAQFNLLRSGKLNYILQDYCELHDLQYFPKNKNKTFQVIQKHLNVISVTFPKKAHRIKNAEWKYLRAAVLRNQKNECGKCGSTNDLQVDHIYPVSKFPQFQLCYWNLQILCGKCNNEKSNSAIEKWENQKLVYTPPIPNTFIDKTNNSIHPS